MLEDQGSGGSVILNNLAQLESGSIKGAFDQDCLGAIIQSIML